MNAPSKTPVNEYSAGGIVYKIENGQIQVAIIYRDYHHDWTLPKGHIEPDETPEQAATREVLEETGLVASIVAFIGSSTFRFKNKHKQLIEKKVDYFLMKLTQDTHVFQKEEVDVVRWFPFLEAVKKLTFPHDRDLVKQAVARIKL